MRHQFALAAKRRVHQADRPHIEAFFKIADRFGQLQAQQPHQPFGMRGLGRRRFVEQFDVDALAGVHQGRVANQGADLDQFLERAEVPGAAVSMQDAACSRCWCAGGGLAASRCDRAARPEARASGAGETGAGLKRMGGAQLRQVAPHVELPAMFVNQLEVHHQMRRQGFELEGIQRHGDTDLVANRARQRQQQRALGSLVRGARLREIGGEFRQRHAATAQLLRQRLQQGQGFLLEHARYQPFAAVGVELIERCQRHGGGDAVARRSGFEVVTQGEFQRAGRQPGALREQVGGDAGGFMPHQIVALEEQQLRLCALGARAPDLEAGAIDHLRRNQRIVEGEDQFLVDQHVRAARFVFQFLDLAHQPLVVCEKRRTGLEFAGHQALSNEQFARMARVDFRILDAALGIDRDAVQGAAFERDRPRRVLFPARVVRGALEQMRTGFLDPLRIDVGQGAGIQAGGFDQFGGHHPLACLATEG